MKICLIVFLITSGFISSFSQKPSYVIYNAKGKKVSYNKMLKSLSKQDIILFGEEHNNPIAHWLQLELTTDLYDNSKLILGAEMLEADNQHQLNQYLSGSYTYNQLDTSARLWSNFKTDYAPLVNFAKQNDISFIATNIPRRYAKRVYKQGFESLDSISDKEQSWIAPLPIPFDKDLPNYKKILTMMGSHGTPNLVKAQAIKDATMAWFILQNYEPNHLFIHYNGAYHSNNYEGILWYLKQSAPDLNYGTISTVSQDDVNKLSEENKHLADFIICVDKDMTKTY